MSDLHEELRKVNDEINRLYWAFTRTKRGKPPCLVRPDLYQRRREIEEALKARRAEG